MLLSSFREPAKRRRSPAARPATLQDLLRREREADLETESQQVGAGGPAYAGLVVEVDVEDKAGADNALKRIGSGWVILAACEATR